MRASFVALVLAATPLAAEPQLEHLSTFVWDRPEDYFGGWSAIEVLDDGNAFIAIGDNAQIYKGKFARQDDTIFDVVWAPVGALKDTNGEAFFAKQIDHIGDSEGIAAFPDGHFAVSFERFPRIILYDDIGAIDRIDLPREASSLHENGGVEALAVDSAGRLIAIPETVPKGAPGFPVWRETGNSWDTIGHLSRSQGFRPVGADIGPDGRLYILERAFHIIGFQNRIRVVLPDNIDPMGELIWTSSLRAFDNLEGLSVWTDSAGLIRLTMISDDNNLAIQETQIVEFRLTP
ncbi:MAG: esterase-like activity of phytase family protein [Boseongicola sp.]|nr:esterase-like activity of phytase family protein [Boseongicola sp.]NNL18059.1 esterase-like activity of phytase family protein [Boseongicola sp.]